MFLFPQSRPCSLAFHNSSTYSMFVMFEWHHWRFFVCRGLRPLMLCWHYLTLKPGHSNPRSLAVSLSLYHFLTHPETLEIACQPHLAGSWVTWTFHPELKSAEIETRIIVKIMSKHISIVRRWCPFLGQLNWSSCYTVLPSLYPSLVSCLPSYLLIPTNPATHPILAQSIYGFIYASMHSSHHCTG